MSLPYIVISQKAPPGSPSGDQTIHYGKSVINKRVSTEEVARIAATRCTIHPADIYGVLHIVGQIVQEQMAQGNQVRLDQIGSFQFSATTGAAASSKEITPKSFDRNHILFKPARSLRQHLKAISLKPKRKTARH